MGFGNGFYLTCLGDGVIVVPDKILWGICDVWNSYVNLRCYLLKQYLVFVIALLDLLGIYR